MKKTIGSLVLTSAAYLAAFTANAAIYTEYTGPDGGDWTNCGVRVAADARLTIIGGIITNNGACNKVGV